MARGGGEGGASRKAASWLTPPNADARRVILFLKRLGPWSDGEIASRVLTCHPGLLASEEADMEGAVARLRAVGMEEERVRELLWSFPGMLYDAAWSGAQLAFTERVFEQVKKKYAYMGSYEV
ncbi:MAG: hypothetical protein J3K34DRAFT_458818 [Monoraphidium minutum]|nr:MAG: hypothetical protein J3K34DRAFT_458818 [Monoraphidium minutum]